MTLAKARKYRKPIFDLHAPSVEIALGLLKEAIGEHYDVQLEKEHVRRGKGMDPVIRIYDKGGNTPRFSMWVSP